MISSILALKPRESHVFVSFMFKLSRMNITVDVLPPYLGEKTWVSQQTFSAFDDLPGSARPLSDAPCPGGPDISTWARSEQISRRPKMGKIEKLCLIQKQLPSMIVTKLWKNVNIQKLCLLLVNIQKLSLSFPICLPLSACLFVNPFLWWSISFSVYLCLCLILFFLFFFSLSLSLSRPIYLAVCLYTYPSMNVYVCIYIYFSIYSSICLSIHLPT